LPAPYFPISVFTILAYQGFAENWGQFCARFAIFYGQFYVIIIADTWKHRRLAVKADLVFTLQTVVFFSFVG
jgi:hypothetical protein